MKQRERLKRDVLTTATSATREPSVVPVSPVVWLGSGAGPAAAESAAGSPGPPSGPAPAPCEAVPLPPAPPSNRVRGRFFTGSTPSSSSCSSVPSDTALCSPSHAYRSFPVVAITSSDSITLSTSYSRRRATPSVRSSSCMRMSFCCVWVPYLERKRSQRVASSDLE